MTKSAGFQCFFSLKRTVTDSLKNNSSIRCRNPTISPQLTGLKHPQKMFNLEKY